MNYKKIKTFILYLMSFLYIKIGIDHFTRMQLNAALDSEENPEVINELKNVLNKSS